MKCSDLLIFGMLTLIPRSLAEDEIHLQWSLCDRDPESVLHKLYKAELEPHKQTPITYYDTDPPLYASRGLMFRTKTRKHQEISLVKVNFPDDSLAIPFPVRCVWDRYGEHTYYTCEHAAPITSVGLWSNEQVQFVEFYHNVQWKRLNAFGPFPNKKWRFQLGGHKAVFDDVEVMAMHLMEIEVKVPKSEAQVVYTGIKDYLSLQDVQLCDQQEPKTFRLFRALGYNGGF